MSSRDNRLAGTRILQKMRTTARAVSSGKSLNGHNKSGAQATLPSHRKNGAPAPAGVPERHSLRPHPETIAAQAGGFVDTETGGIVPPIHVATTFVRDADNQYRRGYCYGRSDNASVRRAELVLNQLEDGASSLLFASGMAAAATAFLALERPAHVVAPKAMYWGLRQWLMEDAPSHGIEATLVDAGDHQALRAAVRPGRTRLVWIETPSNPLWSITDIAEAARIAHAGGSLLAVDSTVPHARAHAAADARRRHGPAFGDKVSQRTLRRCCRRHRVCQNGCNL